MATRDSSPDYDGPAQTQALPVNEDLEIDESRPASTAEEYLLRVRNERRSLPKIFHAKIDSTTFPTKREHSKCFNRYAQYFQSSDTAQSTNPLLLPDKQWRKTFAAAFQRKRETVINEIATMAKWHKSHKRENLRNSPYLDYRHLDIPKYQHRSKWLQFALNVSGTEQSEQFGILLLSLCALNVLAPN